MTTPLMVHTDELMNAIAIVGLGFSLATMPRGRQTSPVDKRLAGLYIGLLLLLILRQLFWVLQWRWLVPAIMIVAAWLPLLLLLLVEEVLRRHAPRFLKWFVLAGGLAASVAALVVGPHWPHAILAALAGYQMLSTLSCVGMIVKNRVRDLSPAETRLADSFALALLVCIPLLLTDFRGLFPDLPVTSGYMGLLIFAVMTSALVAGVGSPLRFGLDMLGLLCAAVVTAFGTHLLLPALTLDDIYRLGATVICVNASVLTVSRLNQARLLGRRRKSIAAALAFLPDKATEDAVISAHPITASGRIIDGEALKLYDAETQGALSAHRVITETTKLEEGVASAVRNILGEYGATHLVRLSSRPLRLLALASGAIGGADPLEVDLAILSRIVEGSHPC